MSFFFCSISKHGQVVYQGGVREFKEVTKSLDSIGPEVIQTLSVSTIHSLVRHCVKSHSIMKCVCLGLFLWMSCNLTSQSEQTSWRLLEEWHVCPRFSSIAWYPALVTKSMFSRAVRRLQFFLRLEPVPRSFPRFSSVAFFPALGTSSTFSRACDQLNLFHPNVIVKFILFQIRNKGPSAVDGSVVTVNFPARFQSSKPESYLLYLLQVEVSEQCEWELMCTPRFLASRNLL